MGVKTGQVVRPDPNVTYASAWPLPYIYLLQNIFTHTITCCLYNPSLVIWFPHVPSVSVPGLSKPNVLQSSSSCILFCLFSPNSKKITKSSKALLSVFLQFSPFSDFHPSSCRLGVNVLPSPQALQRVPPRDVALKMQRSTCKP